MGKEIVKQAVTTAGLTVYPAGEDRAPGHYPTRTRSSQADVLFIQRGDDHLLQVVRQNNPPSTASPQRPTA